MFAAALRLATVAFALMVALPAMGQEAFTKRFDVLLSQSRIAEARSLAESRIAAAPDDAEARFALGVAEFLNAVEGLGQGLYRYGLHGEPSGTGILSQMMFLRIPVPPNPSPQPVTPEGLRQVLTKFDDNLAMADADLAKVPPGPVTLPIDIASIGLDLNGNGKVDPGERLISILGAIGRMRGAVPQDLSMPIHFDESDVPWLRGYANLLMGVTDMLLAYDWSAEVNLTFHNLFPGTELPSSPLRDETQRWVDVLNQTGFDNCYALSPYASLNRYDPSKEPERYRQFLACQQTRTALEFGGIADFVGFVHLIRWPLVDANRMRSARQHFLNMIAFSRESWKLILAETDNNHEWIPGPNQKGPFPRMRVDQSVVTGWLGFIDNLKQVLNGELLLPHWRFKRDRGLDVKKFFDSPPRTLDLVMLIQGSAAIPYIKKGPIAQDSTLDNAFTLLESGFLGYFFWFN